MRNIIGPPVSGENFLFRDKQLRLGLRLMENANSFLMLGIRRTGKSSYLLEVARHIKEANVQNICIEIDCSTYTSVLEFYKGLYEAMPKNMQTLFTKALADSKLLPEKIIKYVSGVVGKIEIGDVKVEMKEKMTAYNKTFEQIVIAFFKKGKNNIFLFIDELPFLFENITDGNGTVQDVQMLLTNLRNWRHAGIPMGITGSLNLHLQLEHLGLSRKLLAGLNTVKLKAYSHKESMQMIEQLINGTDHKWWTEKHTHQLLDLLPDYIPYFIQYAFNAVIVSNCQDVNRIEEIYHNDIIPGLLDDFIYQFDERLKSFKGEELKAAMCILDLVASEETITLPTLQTKISENFNYELLIRLMNYEFLTLSGDQQYSFTLNIIKNWWEQKRNL